jgi:arginine decarboxylase
MSDTLHAEGIPEALVLLHYHVGSQVPDIQTISRATREAARFYAKLKKMGHALGYLDVGGGLGVDYDGSRTVLTVRATTPFTSTPATLSTTSWRSVTPSRSNIP